MARVIVSSAKEEVVIGPGEPLAIIGERINPTGRKKISELILREEYSLLVGEAIAQVAQGARILDVNVGVAGVDEEKVLAQVVGLIMQAVDVPLCIDSSNSRAIAAALSVYRGRALINSVTGEKESLERILPLAREHGAAVIALCMDESGIPRSAAQRVAVAQRILEAAREEGLSENDLLIDVLAMSVGTDHTAGLAALEALGGVRRELGLNTVLGLSNISFGLPDRGIINAAFAVLGREQGLSAMIMDPLAPGLRRLVRAAELVLGQDEWSKEYLHDFRQYQNDTAVR